MTLQGYLTTSQAAARLGVSRHAVRRLVLHGGLVGCRLKGRRLWVHSSEAERFAATSKRAV